MKVCIVTHRNCGSLDGMVAAWILKKVHPEAVVMSAYHDEAPPISTFGPYDVAIFVDVAFSPAYFKELESFGTIVVVLDHHLTSIEELEGTKYNSWCTPARSGAGLALAYSEWPAIRPDSHILLVAPVLETTESIRKIVNYVEDYDLWRHALPNSRNFNLFLQIKVPAGDYEKGFLVLDDIATILENSTIIEDTASELGELLDFQIRVAKDNVRMVTIEGQQIPVVNVVNSLPKAFYDFTISAVAVGHPFAIGYAIDNQLKVRLSMRADNLSGAARRFAQANSGGGHEQSCRCSMPLDKFFQMLAGT